VTLDEDGTTYKVGTPTSNIPYAKVTLLAPCDQTLTKGLEYVAKGSAEVRVLENPTGHRFTFNCVFRVLDPAGTEIERWTHSGVLVKGGDRHVFDPESLLKPETVGKWTTQLYVEAKDIDEAGAAEHVILHHWCRFEVSEMASSSSSSSSGP
jgi:hypothetical protein